MPQTVANGNALVTALSVCFLTACGTSADTIVYEGKDIEIVAVSDSKLCFSVQLESTVEIRCRPSSGGRPELAETSPPTLLAMGVSDVHGLYWMTGRDCGQQVVSNAGELSWNVPQEWCAEPRLLEYDGHLFATASSPDQQYAVLQFEPAEEPALLASFDGVVSGFAVGSPGVYVAVARDDMSSILRVSEGGSTELVTGLGNARYLFLLDTAIGWVARTDVDQDGVFLRVDGDSEPVTWEPGALVSGVASRGDHVAATVVVDDDQSHVVILGSADLAPQRQLDVGGCASQPQISAGRVFWVEGCEGESRLMEGALED